jgi:histidinol-phosphate aminotransferase
MAQQKVLVGRLWPVWPTMVRISVGTPEDMSRFKAAFDRVMA